MFQGGNMKITNDINDAFQGKIPASVKTGSGNANIRKESREEIFFDRKIANSLTSRLESEKRLSEALSMVQTAHSVIQKAMSISSRLRSMAGEYIATGKADNDELNRIISEIKSYTSANTKGQTMSITMPPLSEGHVNNAKKPITIKVPDASEELKHLSGAAEELQSGKKPSPERFADIEGSLTTKSSIAVSAMKIVLPPMNIMVDEHLSRSNITDAGKSAESLSGAIEKNSVSALYAQGNLRKENVKSLLD
jgi:hypothetical protein